MGGMARALIVAALAALALVTAPAAAPARAPDGFFGVMWDRDITKAPAAAQEPHWATMRRSGVEAVRTVFRWADAQPVAGRPVDFARTDRLVGFAARNHIDLLPIVLGAPAWAAIPPFVYGSTPRHVGDYTAYLRALVLRYGPDGSFWSEHPELPRRPLRAWQIWNEPHLNYYWDTTGRRPSAWVREYPRLLRATAPAIRAIDPGATIVLAGLADFAWRHLERLNRHRIRKSFDVASVNLFTSRPKLVLKGLRRFRAAMRRGREARKPLWLTETTWPAGKGRVVVPRAAWQRGWYTTDGGMAQRLRQFYSLAVRHRRKLRLQRAVWYTWASSYRQSDLFDYAGLVRYDGGGFERRPALTAYAAAARRLAR